MMGGIIMRILKIALVFLLIFSFCSCGIKTENSKDAPNENEYTRQYLSKNVISVFNSENRDWMTVDLPEAGLSNLTICCAENGSFNHSSESTSQKNMVYILCDYTVSDNMYHIPYLIVELNDEVLIKDLTEANEYNGSYDDSLFVADVDGDKIDEIVIQQTVGMSGGSGSYFSRIFKVNGDNIEEIFTSISKDSDNSWSVWDTGFTSEFLNGRKLKITNKFTGYSATVDISQRYSADFFDMNGKGKTELSIFCDSFREFVPKDVDNDGIYELDCLQYVSLADHTDYIGDARSILKYNAKLQTFEVVQSEFKDRETQGTVL